MRLNSCAVAVMMSELLASSMMTLIPLARSSEPEPLPEPFDPPKCVPESPEEPFWPPLSWENDEGRPLSKPPLPENPPPPDGPSSGCPT